MLLWIDSSHLLVFREPEMFLSLRFSNYKGASLKIISTFRRIWFNAAHFSNNNPTAVSESSVQNGDSVRISLQSEILRSVSRPQYFTPEVSCWILSWRGIESCSLKWNFNARIVFCSTRTSQRPAPYVLYNASAAATDLYFYYAPFLSTQYSPLQTPAQADRLGFRPGILTSDPTAAPASGKTPASEQL